MYLLIKIFDLLYNIIFNSEWLFDRLSIYNKNNFDVKKYNEIMTKIDDYKIFNKEDIDFITTLPNNKLIYIIRIYNESYTQTIEELLRD